MKLKQKLLSFLFTISFHAKQDAVIMLTLDPAERDAKMAKEALKKSKSGVKHLQVIVEISCSSSPYHLAAVRQAYCALFDCSIEEDITAVASMPLRKVMQTHSETKDACTETVV